MPRYVYEHPDGLGFGAHHAEPGSLPLADRAADRHGAEGAGQHPAMPGELTMAHLDMPHGTIITLAPSDDDPATATRDSERDMEIICWTDAQGTPRRTSVEPAFFTSHFRALAEGE